MAKDLFSNQSKRYAKYRPSYPIELFQYIMQFVEKRETAWDCATGNGQAAVVLSDYFKKVKATDISKSQLSNAVQRDNIDYSVCPAEQTPFPDNSFDLITVAQAYHWINWKEFQEEATRVGKQNAVIAIWMYNLLHSEDERLNALIHHFYKDITGPYWEYERKYVDEGYSTVLFDFSPLPPKTFTTTLMWTKEQLLGYFQTWSAVQQYIKTNRSSPVGLIEQDLHRIWNDEEQKTFSFPIFLRIGRIVK